MEQIQRLRALQWHLLEEQIGHRFEDSLQRIAQRIRKWEDELDQRDPHYRKTVEIVRILRDSRREYLQLRALLLAPLQPTRGRGACLTSLDPHKRDKTRQNPDTLDTTSLPTNDLQQPEQATSHSVSLDLVADEVTSQPTSPAPSTNPPPSSEDVARDPLSDQSKIQNPQFKIGSPSSASPRLCGNPPDTQPLINTPLQRGEPAQPPAAPTALAVSPCPHGESDSSTLNGPNPQPSETIHPIPQPVGVPSSDGLSTSVPPQVAEPLDVITANGGSPALPLPGAAETQSLGENEDPKLGWGEGQTGSLPLPVQSEGVAAPPKKHKPYWLNGHYYENPEYPENIARAMCARH